MRVCLDIRAGSDTTSLCYRFSDSRDVELSKVSPKSPSKVSPKSPGTYRLNWSGDSQGRKLSAGAYFVLIDMGAEKATLKAIIR